MSALDGFYTTLSQASATFGEGVPQTGEDFDGSTRLREAQASVEAAAPDDRWQGAAADAYAAKNQQHAAVYGKLADLDQRMAAEVTNSASVVTAGRRDLDSLRTWVGNLDSTIPRDQSGDRMRLILASKGLGQISDVIQQSTREMTAIGGRVDDIRKEYEEIAGEEDEEDGSGDSAQADSSIPPPKPPPRT
ncbi:EspA/EspE family type VII secretion system effector [Mycobacterium sp. NPDC003449]